MLKIAAAVAVPTALGGATLLYAPSETGSEDFLYQEAYIVEVGVFFDEAAVRAALPEGLEPVADFTGGIAIYGGEESGRLRSLSPLSAGYVWIDLAPLQGADQAPTRYMLTSLASSNDSVAPALPLDSAVLAEEHGTAGEGLLRAVAQPGPGTTLELTVRLPATPCVSGFTEAGGDLLTLAGDERLGLIDMPVVMDHCPAEALSARVEAPSGNILQNFNPRQILWATVAAPLRWAMPVLPGG